MRLPARVLVACSFAISIVLAASAQTISPTVSLDAVTATDALHDGIQVQAGPATMRITALRDDVIRVRVSPDSTLPEDASWAVLAEARTKSVGVQAMQDSSAVGFRTGTLDVRVERNPLRVIIRDLSGNVVSADAVGRPSRFQSGGFSVYK